jgi:hypothetical protein
MERELLSGRVFFRGVVVGMTSANYPQRGCRGRMGLDWMCENIWLAGIGANSIEYLQFGLSCHVCF